MSAKLKKRNEKIYAKRYGTEKNLEIWFVDGKYIREHIDIEFTNFGQHYRFPFIPKHELWLDREHTKGEHKYFIPHLLIEHALMSAGKSYVDAIAKSSKKEAFLRAQDTRKKFSFVTPKTATQKEKVLRKIHKKLLSRTKNGLEIWLVRGELVRNFHYIDFTQGGHEYVYPFVPVGEVWIDDDLFPNERKAVLLHELHERYRMGKEKLPYPRAHKSASALERKARQNPKILAEMLVLELNRNTQV